MRHNEETLYSTVSRCQGEERATSSLPSGTLLPLSSTPTRLFLPLPFHPHLHPSFHPP